MRWRLVFVKRYFSSSKKQPKLKMSGKISKRVTWNSVLISLCSYGEKVLWYFPRHGKDVSQIPICHSLVSGKLGSREVLTSLYPSGRNYFITKEEQRQSVKLYLFLLEFVPEKQNPEGITHF